MNQSSHPKNPSRIPSGALSLTVLAAAMSIVLMGLGDALVPLLIAAFMAYLLFPLVSRLERKGIKKEVAVASALVIALLLGGVAVTLLVPILIEDLKELARDLPRIAETAIHRAEGLAMRLGLDIPLSQEEWVAQAKSHLAEIPLGALKALGVFFGRTITGVVGLFLSVLHLVLIPIFFLHLIAGSDRIVNEVRSWVPPRNRGFFDLFVKSANEIVSAYFRGQVLVAVILGVLYGTGFWIAGLRFGFVIGLLTGLLNVIPYAGPLIGLSLATVVALANFEGIGSLLGVWGAFAIVQGLEGFVITPRIVGDRVGLNALETMIALIVGGNLGGFVGMLVAIPLAGVVKWIVLESKDRYLKSELYAGEHGPK